MTNDNPPGDVSPGERPRATPVQIAAETFLVQDHQVLGAEGVLHLNSLVIRGAEPVVVDTGATSNRDAFLDHVFGLVEPGDIRWIFLSHDDPDHAGNAAALLELCPNATAVTTWIAAQRLAVGDLALPPHRCRWLDDGAVLDTGDRALVAQRPPLYDAPGTRALLDTSTDVLWAADCFSAFVATPTADMGDLDPGEWHDGFVRFHQWNSPWVDAVDAGWWQRSVARLASRQLAVVAPAHGPVLRGDQVNTAIAALRELPALSLIPPPTAGASDSVPAEAPRPGRV